MKDALNLLKERLGKAEAKAARAEKAWESAKSEVADLRTAYRVMSGLAGESDSAGVSVSMGERQKTIMGLLQIGEEHGRSPAELFEAYKALSDEEISIDTFRTTIWRMKDVGYPDEWGVWIVKGDSGSYWKEPASMAAREHLGIQIPPQGDDCEFDETPF